MRTSSRPASICASVRSPTASACSFLPDTQTVERKAKDYIVDELDLRRNGAVLETNRPYLIPLQERLALPADIRGKANPKSSTGRRRRVHPGDHRRELPLRRDRTPGYDGPLYLEVVPLSFPVRVKRGPHAQPARLSVGRPGSTDDDIRAAPSRPSRCCSAAASRCPPISWRLADGLFLSLDLRGDATAGSATGPATYAPVLELGQVGRYGRRTSGSACTAEEGDRVVLAPGALLPPAVRARRSGSRRTWRRR